MWAWVLTWCPLSSLFRELVVNCEHVPSSFELTFYFFIIETVHFQKIIPNRRGNLYNLVLTFVVFHFVRHLGNWASVSAAWDIWGMHKWQVQSNSQSQHKMAKVGDLSDNEKLLFSRLNKGNDMGFVDNKIFLGTFFLFRLGFFLPFWRQWSGGDETFEFGGCQNKLPGRGTYKLKLFYVWWVRSFLSWIYLSIHMQ